MDRTSDAMTFNWEVIIAAITLFLVVCGILLTVLKKAFTIERVVHENKKAANAMKETVDATSGKVDLIEQSVNRHGRELSALRKRDDDLADGLHDVTRIAAVAYDRTERDL